MLFQVCPRACLSQASWCLPLPEGTASRGRVRGRSPLSRLFPCRLPPPTGPALRFVQEKEPEVCFLTCPVLVSRESYRHRRRAPWLWPPWLWDILHGDIFCGNKNQYSLYKMFILAMYAHVFIYTYVHTYVQAQRKRIPSSNGNAVGKSGDQTTFDKSGDRRLIGKEDIHARDESRYWKSS